MNTSELVLVDLSSIAWPVYKMNANDPDPNAASTKIVARVRALAGDHAHVAICCDSGRSFRHDLTTHLDPASRYKAQRPERDEVLHHQIKLSCEALRHDGFPVWSVPGYEADDLIATAVTRALALEGLTVLIVSADKDLMQLVGPRVSMKSIKDGSLMDANGVAEKFKVRPEQMRDYLCLVGDVSDNIKGAEDIGPVKAATLLAKFGTLDAALAAIRTHGTRAGVPLGVVSALRAFEPNLPLTRGLVTMRTDANIPFEELAAERVAQPAVAPHGWTVDEDHEQEDNTPLPPAEEDASFFKDSVTPPLPAPDVPARVEPEAAAAPTPAPVTATHVETPRGPIIATPKPLALARRQEVMPAEVVEYERQLDPRSLKDARQLALDMFTARTFGADYGSPEAVLSTIMVGRELGIPAMSALRSIHIIEGRHSLAASLMVGLVLKSGLAEFFEPIEFDGTKATFETKRKGARNVVKMTYTFSMAETAGLVKDLSNWKKNPMAMCIARAQAMLARLVYPDLLAGLYTPEELEDIKLAA